MLDMGRGLLVGDRWDRDLDRSGVGIGANRT